MEGKFISLGNRNIIGNKLQLHSTVVSKKDHFGLSLVFRPIKRNTNSKFAISLII